MMLRNTRNESSFFNKNCTSIFEIYASVTPLSTYIHRYLTLTYCFSVEAYLLIGLQCLVQKHLCLVTVLLKMELIKPKSENRFRNERFETCLRVAARQVRMNE
jgi:hypothetical protein